MRTSKNQGLPPRLEGARRRFERWRRSRKIRSRIPETLWAAAVKLAEAYGIHKTAKALALDYYGLKKRFEQKSHSSSRMMTVANGATFVELAAIARTGIPECILELEDVEGAKMRIRLKGIGAPELTALSRSLWGIE